MPTFSLTYGAPYRITQDEPGSIIPGNARYAGAITLSPKSVL